MYTKQRRGVGAMTRKIMAFLKQEMVTAFWSQSTEAFAQKYGLSAAEVRELKFLDHADQPTLAVRPFGVTGVYGK